MPALPAPGRLARAGRARAPRGVRRRAVLGTDRSRGSATRAARVLLLGLAPAAHGANRTGRCSPAIARGLPVRRAVAHRLRQPADLDARDDGLRLRGAWITAAVRCAPPANKPDAGRARRMPALDRARARAARAACGPRLPRRVRMGRGAAPAGARRRLGTGRRRGPGRASATAPSCRPAAYTLLGCFHPSQQNTFTGKLTEPMLDAVLMRARELAGFGASLPNSRANAGEGR